MKRLERMITMVKNRRNYYSDYRDLEALDRQKLYMDRAMGKIRELMVEIDDIQSQMDEASDAKDRSRYELLDYDLGKKLKEEKELVDGLGDLAECIRWGLGLDDLEEE